MLFIAAGLTVALVAADLLSVSNKKKESGRRLG
jgi:hypothetical protein